MNKRKPTFLSAGVSSILLVVVLLCMITFSVLSLSGANADLTLSEKTAQNGEDYYEAYSEASKKLKTIDEMLLAIYNESDDEAEYFEGVERAYQVTETTISFTQTISDGDTLEITLIPQWPENAGDTLYRIEKWTRARENTSLNEDAGGLNVLWKN